MSSCWLEYPGRLVDGGLHIAPPVYVEHDYNIWWPLNGSSWCYNPPYGELDNKYGYVVSNYIGYAYRATAEDGVSNAILERQAGEVNEHNWYRGEYEQLYYAGGQWVLIGVWALPGHVPEEVYHPDTQTYTGNAFWSGAAPVMSGGTVPTAPVEFAPRGSKRDASPSRDVLLWWPRFEKTADIHNPYGVYTYIDHNGPDPGITVFVGVPRWTDGDGREYVRSVFVRAAGYEYGPVYRVGAQWIIGTVGDEAGWWVGSEPSLTAPVTFVFTVPAGSSVTGDDRVLTWQDYVAGSERREVWLTEIGIMRGGGDTV